MDSYTEKCAPPIPIGIQRYAYQCENIVISPINGKMNMRGYVPDGRGKEPYPNPEKGKVEHYELEIARFTGNAISITFTKTFKDKSEETYQTNVSFSQLVNLLFEGNPANIWVCGPPVNRFERVEEKF